MGNTKCIQPVQIPDAGIAKDSLLEKGSAWSSCGNVDRVNKTKSNDDAFSLYAVVLCVKTFSKRKRDPAVLSFEESERRALLLKDWTRYKTKQHRNEMTIVARACRSQERALEELRKESEELYQSAIQVRVACMALCRTT